VTDYRFPTRIKKIERVKGPRIEYEVVEEEKERGMIGGRLAASFAEWGVALALWYLKIDFSYKYRIPLTKFQVDFYIKSGPDGVPLDVWQSEGYIDTGARIFRRKVIERVLGRHLWTVMDHEVRTFEAAITVIRRITA